MQALILIGLVVAVVAGPVVASHLTNSVPADDVTLHAPDGPAATFTEQGDANLTDPFPDAHTVRYRSSNGNISVSSTGRTNVTVTRINGTWTNASKIDATGADLTLDPDDKAAATVDGSVDKLHFRQGSDISIGDGRTDFVYSASGPGNVTLRSLPADTTFAAATLSGQRLGQFTSDGNGVATITVSSATDAQVLFYTAAAPELSNPDPADQANITSYDGDISIDISDGDFGKQVGDSVTVEATDASGSTVGSTTVSSNSTVTFSYSPVAGKNEITWSATDDVGETDTFTQVFRTPDTLYIRNESAPTQLVDNSTLDVTFYASNTSLQTTTSNGTVSLDGLPADERIVGVVNAGGYYSRHIVIQSIFSQESVYLLDKNVSAVEDRFTLSDQSGQFEQDETAVVVKRPLTRDYDGDGANETRYETVAADQFGVAGYSLFLEEGVRYRIAVRDVDDYQRLGPYTADVSETVKLQPGEFQIAINDSAEGYYPLGAYEEYQANGGEHQRLTFEYYDAANKTDQLEITVYQQGNASNQLEPTTTLQGPFGATSVNFNLTDAEANKTWVINWTADRGATTVGGEEVVGQNIQTQGASFPEWVQEAAAAATIILTLALFSRVNRETGAVTASMVGGGFWFAGWLPPEAGGAVVVALAVSLIFKTGIPEV